MTTRTRDSLAATPAPSWRIAVASLAIVVVYVLLRLPGIGIPLDRDEGAFGFMGQLIDRGGLPYRDALDHKPPVAFYINALALHFVPPTPQGIHIFLLVYNFLTLVCVFCLAKTCFRSLSAGLCCAFAYAVFSASPAIHGFTASTEMYALLPATLSLLLAVSGVSGNSRIPVFLSGVTGAIACWTKQTAFTSVLFAFLFICIASLRASRRTKQWTKAIEGPALWLTGALLFSAALAFYFYAHGVFREFIYWCFTYELAYARVPLGDAWQAMQSRLIEIGCGDFIFPVAGIAVALWSLIGRQPRAYFLLGFLLLSFMGTIPGYTYPHYFVQLAPAVALAGGYAFFVLLERIHDPGLKLTAAVACGVLVLAISVGANRRYFLESDPNAIARYYFGTNPFPESKALAAFVAGATEETDRVLIVGSEPQILFYAGRRSPSPFLMIYPLTSVHARYKEFQRRMWTDVRNAPPKYILAVKNIPTSSAWDDLADLEILRNLSDFIDRNYTVERQMLVAEPEGGSQGWIGENDSRLAPDSPLVYVYRRRPDRLPYDRGSVTR